MRQGMTELDRLGTSWHRPHQVALLAELFARVGDPATGLRLVVEEAHEQVRGPARASGRPTSTASRVGCGG